MPIGAVYGFLNMVLKYITHSDYLTIALDSGKKISGTIYTLNTKQTE